MIRRSPRTSSKVLLLIAATLWIARVVELSRARYPFVSSFHVGGHRSAADRLRPSTIHNVGSPSARGAFSFPSTHTPSPGFSPGLVSVTPPIEISRPKTRPLSPPRFCPNFSVFRFLGGGTPPREIYSVLHSQPEISVGGVRRERGWEGGRLVFILLFRSRSRRGPFKRTNRGAKKTATEASGTEAP